MDYKTILGVALIVILILLSIPFEKKYAGVLSKYAQDPTARLFAGLLLLYLAYEDIVLGAIAFIVIFLWISDIQLLSTLKLL